MAARRQAQSHPQQGLDRMTWCKLQAEALRDGGEDSVASCRAKVDPMQVRGPAPNGR